MSFRGVLLSSALGLVTSFASAQASNLGIDLNAVNASIDKALLEFTTTSTDITSLKYAYDPAKTDIEKDTYVINMGISLKKAPFADTSLAAQGTLTLHTDLQDPSDKGVSVGVEAQVETDSLALIKFKAKNFSYCEQAGKADGVKGILWKGHCKAIKNLEQVNSIPELQSFVTKKLAMHQKDVKAYQVGLLASLKQLKSSRLSGLKATRSLIAVQLKKTQEVLSFLDKVTVQSSADGFTMEAPAYEGLPFVDFTGGKAEVTANTIKVSGHAKIQVGKILYAASKPTLISILKDLEQGDQCVQKMVKLHAEVLANLLKVVPQQQLD